VEGARLFKIVKAIPKGYGGNGEKVTITIKLINPFDNWGNVGFKIKTYEELYTGTEVTSEFLVDMIEGNQLVPELVCHAPCENCKDGRIMS
jgi:hypothetical protein